MADHTIIRLGSMEDYPSLLESERMAWKGTEVPLISQEQYSTWLTVFPKGLLVAEFEREICGHIFSQICRFDPTDERDNRNWSAMTDNGYASSTHTLAGSTLYAVSFSASKPGAGRKLFKAALTQAIRLNVRYYAGACRIPGLKKFVESTDLPLEAAARRYISAVVGKRLTDPTLTVVLSLKEVKFYRLIAGYFDDEQSCNYGALVAYSLGPK